jgi:hypothetical protein
MVSSRLKDGQVHLKQGCHGLRNVSFTCEAIFLSWKIDNVSRSRAASEYQCATYLFETLSCFIFTIKRCDINKSILAHQHT